ncbi:MAG TPA: hypothetical protein PKY95_10745, partial [candidate division Zixibacteria bacterium]|nr:hypothetical protein [candidate division Zixibacteria bacterium]
NGGLGESFYVVPWLDVLGAETGLIIPRSGFNFVRASLHHKPFMTLLKGNYEQKIGLAEMELFMKRCLAYGVYPGFFDWPPSGLGPGGQYWNHSRYYERDRDLFRKYEPLCQALATAGWEPVTYARSSDPNVYVERFGPASAGSPPPAAAPRPGGAGAAATTGRGVGVADRDPAGVVWLTLTIHADGRLSFVVDSAYPEARGFVPNVEWALIQSRVEPALQAGEPVATTFAMTYIVRRGGVESVVHSKTGYVRGFVAE